MASIPLRLYNREIEGMIDSGQNDEAIEHCRLILKSYPKYIQTYRLLGKTFLETQRYSDASDIFQRLLVVIPDDFVAHVGMSIIQEDENNLDAAIWHMERAFETQPSNTAIQEELRRLYGRRDGIEPPKIRLTRGALARMYARGNLYEQAIAELRAAISEDIQRIDLQVLLAQIYFHAGMRVEAINACKKIINKYPYCFEANRLLAILLSDSLHSEEAEVYRKRLVAMDPYYAYTAPKDLSTEDVPESAVTIERLEYRAGQTVAGATEQPAWASSLGVAFENEGGEQLPEWLLEDESKKPTPAKEEISAEIRISPLEDLDEPTKLTEGETELPPPDQEIPEWMTSAGWHPATGQATESPMSLPEEEIEAEIVEGEIPDWLKGMAPEGAMDIDLPPMGEGDNENILPWLEEEEPSLADKITDQVEEIEPEVPVETQLPDEQTYQTDRLPEVALPTFPDTASEEPQPSIEEELPAWLADLEQSEESPAVILEQLQSTDSSPESTEKIPTPPETPTIAQPDTSDQDAALAWLESLAIQHGAQEEELITPPGERSESPPEWLHAKATSGMLEIKPPTEEEPTSTVPSEVTEEIELPDWLLETETAEEVSSSKSTETVPPVESLDKTELPDWLSEKAHTAGELLSGYPESTSPLEALEELESLEISGEKTPVEGLKSPSTTEIPSLQEPIAPTELPDWLSEIEREEREGSPIDLEAQLPLKPEEDTGLTEWLHEVDTFEEATPTPEDVSSPIYTEEVIIEGSEIESLASEEEISIPSEPDQSNQDAALAWLEGLAVQHGAKEEELITKPEDRSGTPPEWIQEQAVTEVTPEETISEKISETPEAVLPIEKIPSWLQEENIEEVAPEPVLEAPSVTEPAEEIPSWLEDMITEEAASEPISETLAEGEPIEEAISWLQEVTIEEVAPEQVSKAPSEVEPVEEVPSWLLEETIEEVAPEPVVEAPSVAEPVEEVPSWLQDIVTEENVSESISETLEEGEPIEEALPWLKEETIEEVATVPVAEAPSVVEQAEEVPSWLQEETIEEVAPEPVFEPTPSAEQVEELPSWLQEMAAKEAEPEPIAESTIEPAQAEEIPTWLQEEAPVTPVTAESATELTDDIESVLTEARRDMDSGQSAAAINKYSDLLKKGKHLDRIIIELQDALYRFPVDIDIWQTLGDAYMHNDNLQEALEAYTKAEELLR